MKKQIIKISALSVLLVCSSSLFLSCESEELATEIKTEAITETETPQNLEKRFNRVTDISELQGAWEVGKKSINYENWTEGNPMDYRFLRPFSYYQGGADLVSFKESKIEFIANWLSVGEPRKIAEFDIAISKPGLVTLINTGNSKKQDYRVFVKNDLMIIGYTDSKNSESIYYLLNRK